MKKYLLSTAVFTVITIIAGCGINNNKAAGSDDDHAHDETIQLTAYSSDFELFVDASPFVAGQASNVLAHFSHLKNFKPLEEGKVTVSLIVGTDGIRQTLDKPTKTGIYFFRLSPQAAGSGRIVFDMETASGKHQIIVPDITVYADEHEAYEAAAAGAATSIDGVAFTKEQSWKVDFATAEARLEPFGQIIRTTAQIQLSHDDERIISAKTGGTVFFNAVVTEGKTVNKGQTLFTIDASAVADNNLAVRYAEAQTEHARAKTEYERKTELAKDNIVSQSDLLRAKTEFTNAETVYNNLRQNFSAGKQSVSSPINGYVTRVLAQKGQYVEAGQPILIVSRNRDLLIKAELQPKHFRLLGNITGANIRILNSNQTFSLESLGGRVLSYGRSADISNPLIPVVFQVSNNEGFLAGSFVEMFIKTLNSAQAVTVPNEAIIEEMGNKFVFVQLTPQFFDKRSVKTGLTDGFRMEIKDGLRAGERVVSKGAIFVKLSQASGALDPHAGHAH
ncbi:MAG: efflux RND transporter periplasmic adaptor subunit [Chitinispirillales bacterium]|jgi:RND family efflux transporter MFP subunit|nr:efflux RND transporter periplasmic adaptor subunit [Chitinispirillales bacterium]